MAIPAFDVTVPRDLMQDVALAELVLRRFQAGEVFTPGDAGVIISVMERMYDRIADLYALGLLAEESGELIQIVGKALRFGMDAAGPNEAPYNGMSARELLPIEAGDVGAAIDFAVRDGVIDGESLVARWGNKLARLLNPRSRDSRGSRLAPEPRGKAI